MRSSVSGMKPLSSSSPIDHTFIEEGKRLEEFLIMANVRLLVCKYQCHLNEGVDVEGPHLLGIDSVTQVKYILLTWKQAC